MTDKQTTTSQAVVDPIDRTKLAKRVTWAEESASALAQLPALPEHETWWDSKLSLVHAALKEHEADRTEVTGPINKELKRINGEFKPGTDRLEALKDLIKGKLGAIKLARLEAQEATRLAAVAAAAAGDAAGCSEALAAIPEDVVLEGSTGGFMWVAVVEDFTALPDFYKIQNDIVIDAHINCTPKGEEPKPIPGIKFERRPIVRVKATRSKSK